jgi:acyl-CoA reductase-like NAD-dependent aldehyde dehydrogenase
MQRQPASLKNLSSIVEGKVRSSRSDDLTSIINPSTARVLYAMPSGCEADVNVAVESSRLAFEKPGSWADAPPTFRKRVLHRFGDLVIANAPELDRLDAQEMGKPISVAFCNAQAAGWLVQFFAEAVDKACGDVFVSDRLSLVLQRRIPRGVVGAIVPWNFPTFNAVLKLAPALAAGNCVVLKPSELSPSSAMRLAELALEAGMPPGVFNVLLGLGETVGRALALHMDVDMVTFTGSTEVGKRMLEYAGQSNLKVITTECGGKSPQIVFNDGVDLDQASASIANLIATNQGQICSVGSRVLVHRDIHEELIAKVASHLRTVIAIGDPLESETSFGPLASLNQFKRVSDYVKEASIGPEVRAVVVDAPIPSSLSDGYFTRPVIFGNVSPRAKIAQEEVFGPVLAVIPFSDEAEAISLANNTKYALAAYVWTADLGRGMRMAKGVKSTVFINAVAPTGEGPGHALSVEPTKQSGFGAEGGVAGMETYLRRQLVWISHD